MSKTYNVIDIDKTISFFDYSLPVLNGVVCKAGSRAYGTYGNIVYDDAFETHYTGFHNRTDNIPVGVYFFSQAINNDEAIEEANETYKIIKNKDIKFPIYLNSGASSHPSKEGRGDLIDVETRTNTVIAYLNRIKELGYRVGLLVEEDWLRDNLNYTKIKDEVSELSLWISTYSSPVVVDNYDAWRFSMSEYITGTTQGVHSSIFYKDVAGWEPESEIIDINTMPHSLEYTSVKYDGTFHTPKLTIEGCTEGLDYTTVTYENNRDVGIGLVKTTGINNYKNDLIMTFNITNGSIEDIPAHVNGGPFVYSGDPITPVITLDNLTEGLDFTVSYTDNINAGIATAIITGINRFSGTNTITFEIEKKSLTQYTVDVNPSRYKYTGTSIRCTFSVEGLVEGEDYLVSYSSNINVGIGKVILTGKGNYKDQAIGNFSIVNMNLSQLTIELSSYSYPYTGYEIKPVGLINNLVLNEDYTLRYVNNINAGTAKIIAEPIGLSEGTCEATFLILSNSIDDKEIIFIDGTEYKYTGNVIRPKIKINGLKEDRDYYVTYPDASTRINIDSGKNTAKVFITGTGNYKGYRTEYFTIVPRDIEDCIAKLGTPTTKSIYRIDGEFELYTSDGLNKLTLNTDYIIVSNTRNPEIFDPSKGHIYQLATIMVSGIKGSSLYGDKTYEFKVIPTEPPEGTVIENVEKYNYGTNVIKDIEEGIDQPCTCTIGNCNFGDLEIGAGDSSDVPWLTNWDFNKFCNSFLDGFDDEDGDNPDAKEDPEPPVDDDDYRFDFGEHDEHETNVGNYDFGDLDEGIATDSLPQDPNIAKGDYDFNELCGDYSEWSKEGKEYILSNTPIYPTHGSKKAFDIRSGSYIIYKHQMANGKIRITRSYDSIGRPCRSVGWCKLSDLKALTELSIGDIVRVEGSIYQYTSGTGNIIDKDGESMYVKEINPNAAYPYGLSSGPRNPIQGYAIKTQLTIIYKEDEM